MFWGRVEAGKNIYIWAGRMWFWFIPKTASTASSSTGALVAAGSLQLVHSIVIFILLLFLPKSSMSPVHTFPFFQLFSRVIARSVPHALG
jgi:hypothetical protein